MTTLIYSDPHLGVHRTKNTTPASRARLKEAIYQATLSVVHTDNCEKVCCGDLFDTYSNPEEVIQQGRNICDATAIMLGGNHDVVARADKVGSLELLSGTADEYTSIVHAGFNKACVETYFTNDSAFYCVPHVTTQALFEESLEEAAGMASRIDTTGLVSQRKSLLVHCNYETPYEVTETTLNMTEELAEDLLKTFNYIFMGHEHQPRDLFGGRLLIIGNVHPTGFADISNKYVVILDDAGARRELIWDAKENYEEVNANLLEDYDAAGIEFLRITGDVKPEDVTRVSRQVAKIWKQEDSPYAIKLDVEIMRDSDEVKPELAGSLLSLPERIERELTGSALLPFWEEFKNELQ